MCPVFPTPGSAPAYTVSCTCEHNLQLTIVYAVSEASSPLPSAVTASPGPPGFSLLHAKQTLKSLESLGTRLRPLLQKGMA